MKIRAALLRIYWIIQDILVPSLKYSQFLYEDVLDLYVTRGMKWLDVGCGHQVLPPWRAEKERDLVGRCKMVVGIDYDLGSLRKQKTLAAKVNGDVTNLPFATSAFGLATANMLVEHLRSPEDQFREINRVLEPGGIFICHTPNVLGYTTIIGRVIPEPLKKRLIKIIEGRSEEDIFPTFYRTNSRKKIEEVAKATGFQLVKIKMLVSSASFVMCPPIVMLELIWIRILMTRVFKALRTNIIAILRKQS